VQNLEDLNLPFSCKWLRTDCFKTFFSARRWSEPHCVHSALTKGRRLTSWRKRRKSYSKNWRKNRLCGLSRSLQGM